MAESNQKIVKEMKKINLEEKIPVENKLSVEDKYMLDCLNMLDDQETNIDKMAKVSHQFLLVSSIKDAHKVIQECEADGKVPYNEDQRKKNLVN